ncbi:ThuA domain-containing protein [Paenibacillus qinlingensis]|uniref:ThuA domain-containing protein n=1 Tax=Paenibacillus qinlingensis TaxID=1837343 RepID=UPI001566D9D9|nr:ThuA domain-containing protein [Paenibacillus qinlingensis]NQX60741.1 ThuA domain-containing protein [Paenibacillus qinlingensis]
MNNSNVLAGKHIVFVSGEDEYDSDITLATLAKEIEESYGARVTLLTSFPNPSFPSHIPHVELLKEADLAVLYLRFRELPEEQLQHILTYVESGKPIVAFRTSTHAFRYPEGHQREELNDKFGIDVLGAPWIHHFGHSSSTNVSMAWGAEKHPIVQGISPFFHVRSWLYHTLPYPLEGARILLNGHTVDPELDNDKRRNAPRIHPVAWTRTNAWGGKVFMTTMGHPEDFHNASFRKLVNNSIVWALLTDEEE